MITRHLVILFLILIIDVFPQENKEGRLTQLIENIKNAMPLRDSNKFTVPSSSDQEKFAETVALMSRKEYDKADSVAQTIGYVIYKWKDTGYNNKVYYILMEPSANVVGGVSLGWGTYIYNENGSNELVVEVPHPLWDTNTWEVGFRGYQQIDAQYFLMSGTHRYANGKDPAPADPAHNILNIFYTVHTKVADKANHVFQFHGFNSSSSKYDGYPDIILSNGTASPSQILEKFKTEINDEGYSVGIFDGINYSYLGATTNTEGHWSNANGLSFIHCEIDYFIRTSDSKWENLLDAFSRTFKRPTGIIDEEKSNLSTVINLEQNYPNPFNSETQIQYQLIKDSFVQLEVYNSLGKKITTMVSKNQTAGNHSIHLNLAKLNSKQPSGVYIYNLTVDDNYSLSRKMIYLK